MKVKNYDPQFLLGVQSLHHTVHLAIARLNLGIRSFSEHQMTVPAVYCVLLLESKREKIESDDG